MCGWKNHAAGGAVALVHMRGMPHDMDREPDWDEDIVLIQSHVGVTILGWAVKQIPAIWGRRSQPGAGHRS